MSTGGDVTPGPDFPSHSSTETIKHQIEQKGFADVMVTLKSGAFRLAAGARGFSAAAGIGQADVSQSVSTLSTSAAVLPADLLACFESAYEESVGGPGLSLSLRTAPRAGQVLGSLAGQVTPVKYLENLEIVLGSVGSRGLNELEHHGLVKSVRPVPELSLIHPTRIANAVVPPGDTWGIERLKIPALWKQGLDGNGVIAGHLDTGADGTHPMLRNAFTGFWESNYIGEAVIPAPAPHDSGNHGTHTAGTIVGREVNGYRMGVAPRAQLASGMVIEGGSVTFRILAGLNWVVGMGVRVLNMSLGIPGVANDFLDLTRIVRERGILLIVAAGNDKQGTSRSPGNYSDVVSVGAMNEKDEVASFSSSDLVGQSRMVPDLVAPGVNVISCTPGGKYLSMDGTSMATPHIAGLACLLFQAKPDATVDKVEEAIFASCQRPASMAPDRANRGIPNGEFALNYLLKR